jgi:LacI family transcriptional regulator
MGVRTGAVFCVGDQIAFTTGLINMQVAPNYVRPTIRDVARAAGVSPATVSLVWKNSPRISSSTAARVREHITRLNYIPSPEAQQLAAQRSWRLALAS